MMHVSQWDFDNILGYHYDVLRIILYISHNHNLTIIIYIYIYIYNIIYTKRIS